MKARDPMDAPFRGFAFVFKKIPSERAESPMDPRGGSPYNKALRAAQKIANAEGKTVYVDHVTRGGQKYWIIWERRYEGQYTKAEEKHLIDLRDVRETHRSVEVSPSKKSGKKKTSRDSSKEEKWEHALHLSVSPSGPFQTIIFPNKKAALLWVRREKKHGLSGSYRLQPLDPQVHRDPSTKPHGAQKSEYEIFVSNMGLMLTTNDYAAARERFHDYVTQSREGRGRVGNENVTLMKDGRIINEWDAGKGWDRDPMHRSKAKRRAASSYTRSVKSKRKLVRRATPRCATLLKRLTKLAEASVKYRRTGRNLASKDAWTLMEKVSGLALKEGCGEVQVSEAVEDGLALGRKSK